MLVGSVVSAVREGPVLGGTGGTLEISMLTQRFLCNTEWGWERLTRLSRFSEKDVLESGKRRQKPGCGKG
jgi:hypothetical protein